jgi:hypothetical protein
MRMRSSAGRKLYSTMKAETEMKRKIERTRRRDVGEICGDVAKFFRKCGMSEWELKALASFPLNLVDSEFKDIRKF